MQVDTNKLEEMLEVVWLEAKGRGDKRGELMALVGMTNLKMAQCQLEASHNLKALCDLFPTEAGSVSDWREEVTHPSNITPLAHNG